jgi:hypothetical protein
MIEIVYKLWSEEVPRTRALNPVEYFDPLEDDEFFYEESGFPRFDHAVDYLDEPPGSVEWTRLVVAFGEHPTTVFTRFSRDGRMMFWHLRNPDGHQEMCIESQIDADRIHLARFRLDENGDWIPGYVAMIQNLANGSQSQDRIFPTLPPSPSGDA